MAIWIPLSTSLALLTAWPAASSRCGNPSDSFSAQTFLALSSVQQIQPVHLHGHVEVRFVHGFPATSSPRSFQGSHLQKIKPCVDRFGLSGTFTRQRASIHLHRSVPFPQIWRGSFCLLRSTLSSSLTFKRSVSRSSSAIPSNHCHRLQRLPAYYSPDRATYWQGITF